MERLPRASGQSTYRQAHAIRSKGTIACVVAKLLRTRDRLLYGVLAPIGIMLILLFTVMLFESAAGAAEFAALGIMLGAMIAMPFVLIINLVIVFQAVDTPMACFIRGMIFPGIVLIGAVVYQTGLWDAVT